ncbi:MAG TPA: endo-1,4-beta-xylanase [Terracidiphilus sp.]|nr:endo-1,4-beta-xylanase [Terracidiphilus sp.]
MLCLVSDCKRGTPIRRALRFFFPTIALALLGAVASSAQTVATYDFENGSTDGWVSFYNASTPVSTNAAAYSGSYSLLTTTSAAGTGGPSLNVSSVLQAGATYTITGWVMLTPGESATNANFTVARTDPACSGGTCYDTIGPYQVPVSDSGWTQIGGSYTPSTTETGLLLYAQLVGATSAVSFYLDDVVITQTASAPGGTPVATYTFSDGGTDGWFPFGSPTLSVGAPPVQDPNGDTNSLLTSNRTATYMGPALNLVGINGIVAGATYQVSAYVLLASTDSSGPTVTMSTKLADCATSGTYSNLGTTAGLTNGVWTKVQGTFSFSNQPGPPTSLDLYFQSSSATDSFYISDVRIGEISPPPPSPSQQDNSGITSTFEDGGLDGWSSRSGSSSVTNSTAAAHTGTHSLLTMGRIANWDGPSISVSDKMYPGSVYNVSGWVMLTPADGSSHVINMSLQTTLSGNTSYPSITAYPGITVPADGQWHQISVLGYNMSSAYDQGQATLYFQTVPPSGNDLVSFYLDDFQLSYVPPPTIQTNIPSIYKTLANDFPIGAAIDPTDLSGPHEQLLTTHFNSITSGNDMKWSSVEPSLGNFTFGTADQEVGVAVCNNMLIRGHNLVWATGAQTPSYAFGDGTNSPANQATVTANIQEHIMNEVQHFGSKVGVWDVVNEPLDPTQPDCLEHGPFYQVLGKSYIDIAFQAARQYAPAGTELFLNDYSTSDPNRLACLVKVVADLRSRGIPIDGVGHEMHNAINYPSVQAMVHAIDTMHFMFPGLKQQVTEYDESVYNAGDDTSNYGNDIPPSVLAEQGWLYDKTFDAFKRLKGEIERVTLWGMADDDTWLDSFPVARTDYPLPFDMGLQAKPAYWGIVDRTQLPGYGLEFSAAVANTGHDTYAVTVTATNGDVGPAYATQINSFTLYPDWGDWRCQVSVTAPSGDPVVLGDIATSGTASAVFNVTLKNCNSHQHFSLVAPWSNATYHTGTLFTFLDFEDNDHH